MTLNPHEELLDRARKAIHELRQKLAAAEARSQSAPVAVIGLGLRFPGCGSDPEQFWQMIVDGRDAVTTIPPGRWNSEALYAPGSAVPGKMNTRHGAFLNDVRRFDTAFFDITPREAVRMDPQQRIFLETAWHAIEDAGLTRARLAGSDAGVFVGVHNHSADYQAMQFERPAGLDAYSGTGTAHDMIAGRLAYWLDLHGPAIAVNTACSSSLTAVHLACRSLRADDCSLAIAGGINLLLSPWTTVAASQLQLLSPDGRCKTFDARADGMGRGEGCGVVVLKKLDAAVRDGDRVLGVIRGSAVNQDGKTNGLTAPNGLAQQQVLRRALKDAGVDPTEIGYVEAHGTGTALGDPIEVEALAEVLGGGSRTEPCTLGAVKANIGHLEGAAGIAGLIKTLLVLRHRWLPPVARLGELNHHLAFARKDLEIPREGRAWKTSGKRLAGVSSFGFSGTNVHVVLEEAPPPNAAVTAAVTANRSASSVAAGEWPVLVSAQSVEALHALASAYADRLELADEATLAAIGYTSAVRRTHHALRIAVRGTNAKEMALHLRRRIGSVNHEQAQRDGSSLGDGKSGKSSKLEVLVREWEAGAEVDWTAVVSSASGIVDLPLYPFQGRDYWLAAPAASGVPSLAAPAFAVPESPAVSADRFLPQDWLYATHWVEKPLHRQPAPAEAGSRTWLVIDSEKDFGAHLAESIRARGDKVIHARAAGNSAEQWNAVFRELAREEGKPGYAVYLPNGQNPADQSPSDQAPAEWIAGALEVTQAMLRTRQPMKLWFVTQGIEPAAPAEAAPHPAQAAMRGFSRVFGLEHPEYAGGTIDIDSGSAESADAVCAEISAGSQEDRVALRGGRRYVARLCRDSFPPESARLKLDAHKCYLVTGAFGRLGLRIAAWLVDRGARHLALIGRRSPQETGGPELMAQLEAWRGQGRTVLAEACDVSDAAQVNDLLARIGQAGTALGGVLHAAAGLRFSPLEEASRQDADFAFQAKYAGARILDDCTRERSLDFFVLFNSAAATIGLRNGALYAAANSCLDAIVLERRQLGLPVLSVEWGFWEQSGEDPQQRLIEQAGFLPMQSECAFRALEALLISGRDSSLVAAIDWTVLYPALEMRGRHLLAAEVIEAVAEGGVASAPQAADISARSQRSGAQSPETQSPETRTRETQWFHALRDLPPLERRYRLLDFVGNETRQVFGMRAQDRIDESRGLFEQGMDSLMSVRLKRRLESGTGLRLPGTLTLTYPSIAALAGYLDGILFPTADAPAVNSQEAQISIPSASVADASDSVANMDELETNAAIAAELAAIQQKLGVL